MRASPFAVGSTEIDMSAHLSVISDKTARLSSKVKVLSRLFSLAAPPPPPLRLSFTITSLYKTYKNLENYINEGQSQLRGKRYG